MTFFSGFFGGGRGKLSILNSLVQRSNYTFQPKVGRNDAQRNCVSNIRLEGLSYDTAAHRLMGLMRASCARNLSGVLLKDEANDTDACALTETPLFSLV